MPVAAIDTHRRVADHVAVVKRSLYVVTLGTILALLSGQATHASGPRAETKAINAADQAAARAVVVERADLRPQGGWKGGATKPEYLLLNCPYYHPDLSRFVITGEAATRWSRASSGLGVLTETSVGQTAQMLRREWQIQFRPEAIRCVRSTYASQAAAAGAVFVSLKRVSFPHIATYSTAFELRASVGRERQVADLVFIGQGRTGITLAVSGAQSARRIISAEAIRLARILVGRIQA
jgi:hypothetical protein